jgi:hypothetical protein
LILVALLAPVASVSAQDQSAAFAANLFFSLCLIEKGNPDSPSRYPEFRLNRLRPDAEEMFLSGKPGKAWGANASFGNFVVSITDDRLCSVHVRRVAASKATEVFLLALKHITDGGAMQELPREEKNYPYGTVVTRSFAYLPKQQDAFYLAVLSTTDAPDAPVQAIMSSRRRDGT